MYSEISTQFLYTKEEFENTSSRDLLQINCPCCKENFEFTKHKIQTNWRRSTSKILYCSYECSTKARKTTVITETINCLHCNKEFEKITTNVKTKDQKFCSKTCSVIYMNTHRSEEEREAINTKLSLKLKGKYLKKYRELTLFPKFIFTLNFNIDHIISTNKIHNLSCQVCSKSFKNSNKNTKLCSKECFKIRMQQMHLEKPHLILNRSNPESYLEKSFREYVEQKGYIKNESFIQEKHWTLESGKRYISDFYFPTLKLIVEMDGLQHEQTQEEDKLKDYSIYNEFKIKTLRITHKEWTKKTRLTEIENIF